MPVVLAPALVVDPLTGAVLAVAPFLALPIGLAAGALDLLLLAGLPPVVLVI